MSAIQIILIGMLGSALQELLHWYGLREHLGTGRYKALMRSIPYWVITGLMIVGSGVAVWAWFAGDGSIPARQYLVLGAALPLIFKKAVEVVTGAKPGVAASSPTAAANSGKLADYFQGAGGSRVA
ncbi:hypothetical protein HUA74_26445 [Myxococcus sp. CA051A]|uniref:hypothetical protein n=2 Tax=Myxococcus TaxID=32 RepID=UPI00157B56F2|nr:MULTISPECIES: hypothetical protein [unclassified Myxococcus]NTX02079.1 hypothetical protein [Myxococcus sp. CA040A]NTX14453.1 hypothetical protein [Myxococcus sp. CA056]NTX56815.1 hypothetical protein [Myxococcus sp. CA039A]NTX64202.1 hypothetical protein [Myxococcus sp. CA051A]